MKNLKPRIVQAGLSFGQAMHEAIVNGRCVARANWGGYWYNNVPLQGDANLFTEPVLVAVLKDGVTVAPATPYNADIQATDWMIVATEEEN